jgi:hypothetical protein
VSVQLAWLWNSLIPTAPSGRLNAKPNTDGATPVANDTMHIPNGGGGGVEYRTTTTEALGQADQGKIVSFSNASAIAVTVDTPTDTGWKCAVFVNGAGTATFTPSSGTINGASSLAVATGQNGVLWWDGTNYLIMLGGGAGTGLTIEVNGTPTSNQEVLNFTSSGGINVSNPSGGIVNIGGSGGGGNPTSRRWAYGSTSTNNLSSSNAWVGDGGGDNGGTIAYVLPTGSSTFNKPVTSMVTAGTTNSQAYVASNCAGSTSGWTAWGKNMLFTCLAGPGGVITSVRIRFGVGNTASVSTWISTDTITTVPYAAFRFSTNAGDTDWMCETGSGSAANVVSSGVAVAANTLYTLQIQFNDATPNVVFSINGTVVYTSTTDLPSSGALAWLIALQTLTGTTREAYASWIYEEADN